MSFFEDIASALDAEGIESRVNDDVMFVPITSDLEIQFVEIDPILPAANVYIAAADVDEDDEDFEAVLVSVAFSVDDAVEAVAKHIATDQVVTVLRDLLEGTDERITDLEFVQDEFNPNLVVAEVANDSELRVLVETVDGVPSAIVRFLAFDFDEEEFDELEDEAINELWESDVADAISEEQRLALFEAGARWIFECGPDGGVEPLTRDIVAGRGSLPPASGARQGGCLRLSTPSLSTSPHCAPLATCLRRVRSVASVRRAPSLHRRCG